MAHLTGEPTCLHHTFTHAKALAALICAESVPEVKAVKLPCEEKFGIRSYQQGHLLLVSHGCFRATFSTIHHDCQASHTANSGGSMNLLYHEKYGILCAATTTDYFPTEPLNQQYLRKADNPPCMTAQFVIGGTQACRDRSAKLTYEGMRVMAEADKWQAKYDFGEDELTICLECDDGIYDLPIVCGRGQKVIISEDKKTLAIEGGMTVVSEAPMNVDPDRRVFHQVGGLAYLPVSIPVNDHVNIVIK
jgi:hypothetical protein